MAGSLDLSALVNWLSGQCFRPEELVELCAQRRRGRHAVVAAETQAARSLARAHLELGRIAVNAGNKAAARPELQQAIALGDSDNDPGTAEEARRLMK